MGKRVVFCTPALTRPMPQNLDSLEKSMPLISAAGWDDQYVNEIGNPYISAARAMMLRRAMDTKPDVVVFIDYDMSWNAQDLLTLIETEGDVVAGTYRYKKDDEEYMGVINSDVNGHAITRADGCISATRVPAGFLKITAEALNKFAIAYPNLMFGPKLNPSLDLFNHGAHEGVWWGEDYAFCRNWKAIGGDIWLIPNLNLNHHTADKEYAGNYHEFLMRQPGGSKATK